jgi:tRNA-2-methylthio-N6-dimethylallyladenosine synthase
LPQAVRARRINASRSLEVFVETALSPAARKVFLETFGCQSNALESLHLAHMLRQAGFLVTDRLEDADVALFNTCSVRQHAEDKVFSRLGQLTDWKREREGRLLGVLGCMAVIHKETLLERVSHLDLVLGPDQYPKAAEILRRVAQKRIPEVSADFDPTVFPLGHPASAAAPHRAFVEIMKGCDKFCTFCVVPFTRGREVSRDKNALLEEVRRLADSGVREVTLLGQNVNSYGKDADPGGGGFPGLLWAVAAVPGLERVRFMTSHPLDLSDDLAAVFSDTPKVCEYIHLPVQCGSDRILKRMNRKHDVPHYLGRVRTLRAARPGMSFSTDLIVGFPGETEEDFGGTLKLMEEVRYDFTFSFKYSARKGTPAARMLDKVPEEVKEERLSRLNEKANAHMAERAAARVGLVEEVMVDGPADRTPGSLYGKSRQGRVVVFPGDKPKPGDLVNVRITSQRVANLFGDLVGEIGGL